MDIKIWIGLGRNFFLCLLALAFAALSVGAQAAAVYPPGTELDDDGVPVLIKHLPDWENAKQRAVFATNLSDLKKLTGNRAILNEIEFVGGTEAATAIYDKSRVVIIEFATPQVSIETDRKINAKLEEIAEPTTQTAYRRIGNYAVFVFDAPNEAAANDLLSQVSYEKEVQWLGGNPFSDIVAARRQRRESQDIQTAGEIIVTVIKTAGLAIVAALGLGGLCGAWIFYHRRRRQNGVETFSDAGGMMRLNLDDLTTNPNRLLDDGQAK